MVEGKEPKPRKSIHGLPRQFFLNLSEGRTSPADLEGVKRLSGCVSPRVQPPRDPRVISAIYVELVFFLIGMPFSHHKLEHSVRPELQSIEDGLNDSTHRIAGKGHFRDMQVLS